MNFLSRSAFEEARQRAQPYIHRTPVLQSKTLSDAIGGAQVYLKAELFQKAGSYKVRGPLNVLAQMSPADKARGIQRQGARTDVARSIFQGDTGRNRLDQIERRGTGSNNTP